MSEPKPITTSWRDTLARYDSGNALRGRDPEDVSAFDALSGLLFAAHGDWDEMQRERGMPTSDQVPVEDVLAGLLLTPKLRERIDDIERGLLEAARDRGMSWPMLAEQLLGGGSEQAMQQRYRRLGGKRSWRGTARTSRAAELKRLREALTAANAAHASTADWIRAKVAFREVLSDVLAGDALSVDEARAATGAFDYTIFLARDTDRSALKLESSTDDGVTTLLAMENWLTEIWVNPPQPHTLREQDRHLATPHPLRTWHELDAAQRDQYRALAEQQLRLPPPPARPRWYETDWPTWFRLLAEGTITAVPEQDSPGYWALHTSDADVPGIYLGSEMDESLAELAAAGLTILDHAGAPLTVFDWTTARRNMS
ncbi:hypothetical protein [Amycolatopsis sp. TNS106]|uniref:hypothetical protein n=1 Tax=Amycolatopsis sp. TNS106 TaxID=2861750 RepID=UPI001C595BB0|nr:hypothetical protein [Amycolatopsis sp. TNS106]QXV63547.1 hypothetical protein CVV72_41025 [Amycolatopsis sp. TNS106]